METIGRYRLERRLGAGSFATVWLGHDDDLDVPVAVKVLADNWASNDDVRNRFLTEARIMRRIRDPRMVQVYDIGTLDDGRPYFVMDYINGGSMAELRRNPGPPAITLRLCAQACRAVQLLHDNSLIHRDITPANMLMSTADDGSIKVMVADLGVAKSMIDAGATMTAGTPTFMALEQASGDGPLDHRADIYSLTALTYSVLTGHPPFQVRSIADILARDPAAEPAPIAADLGAPPALDAVMVSGLASEPNRRPPSAVALGEILDQIAGDMEMSLSTATVRVRPGTFGLPPTTQTPPAGTSSADDVATITAAPQASPGSGSTPPPPAVAPGSSPTAAPAAEDLYEPYPFAQPASTEHEPAGQQTPPSAASPGSLVTPAAAQASVASEAAVAFRAPVASQASAPQNPPHSPAPAQPPVSAQSGFTPPAASPITSYDSRPPAAPVYPSSQPSGGPPVHPIQQVHPPQQYGSAHPPQTPYPQQQPTQSYGGYSQRFASVSQQASTQRPHQPQPPAKRSTAFYLMVAIIAVALFAVAMYVTVLLAR